MKQKWKVTAGILTVVVCMLFGCEKRSAQGESLLIVPVDENVGISEDMKDGTSAEPDMFADVDIAVADTQNSDITGNTAGQIPEEKEELVIHICGAVNCPGVYIFDEGSRIYQAIEAAGGFSEEAEEDYLNQADLLADGMKIYVPTAEEVQEQKFMADTSESELMGGVGDSVESGLVNINTASLELLCTLPGVGEGKAQSIITYREENGKFQTIEEIMKVDGIKNGLFRKIKDKIVV